MGAAKKTAWGSIAGTSVIIHLTNYPDMERSELEGAVRLEAEQFISRDWEEIDFDYQVLEALEEGGYRVLFVAAPKELSDRNIVLFKKAGLYPIGMNVNSLAMATAFQGVIGRTGKAEEESGALLLHIGAENSSLALLHGHRITVLRDVSFGGNDITKSIMQEFNTEFEDAERIKLEGGGSETRIKDSVERAIRPLSQQISMTMGYEQRSGNLGDGSIFLVGGGCRAPGLPDMIKDKFHLPVKFLNPFAALPADCDLPNEESLLSDYTIAFGCALIGSSENGGQ